ncbi:MAG: maleylacetoacetate isomerase [Acidiferrobacterales bacterium]|nr:maleylacetoacetate isomerase [Acidiferrobacterales bacterium]
MKLYGYFRSSAAYRVRIALNLKQIDYEDGFVHLRNNEMRQDEFLQLNPQGLVPVLDDNSVILTQSIAIIEYLEEKYPTPRLLPECEVDRAFVRSVALSIACDIHPLNNLRVLRYLAYNLSLDDAARDTWYRHWIAQEFQALESRLVASGNDDLYCFGDTPTMADVCLVPQMANARRFQCDLSAYPRLVEIDANCRELAEFTKAAPENQPDAEN